MLTPERQRVLIEAKDTEREAMKARLAAAEAHGRKLAAESMTLDDFRKWDAVPNTIAARQVFVGTEVEGFTFADTSEVRAFINAVAAVRQEAEDAAHRKPKPTEEERDAHLSAIGWRIEDPGRAERAIEERREARRAQLAEYERRKAAGENVQYPA